MQLSNREKRFLSFLGYSEKDIEQIKKACKFCRIEKGVKNERITHRNFIKLYGKDNFLLSLARAAFHYTSSYTPEKNIFYIFDCFGYFDKYAQKIESF